MLTTASHISVEIKTLSIGPVLAWVEMNIPEEYQPTLSARGTTTEHTLVRATFTKSGNKVTDEKMAHYCSLFRLFWDESK